MKTLRDALVLAAIATLVVLSARVAAIDSETAGLWFDPDAPGHGILVEYNASTDESAILWFNYDGEGGQLWLISEQNCVAGEPCVTALLVPSGTFMMTGGEVDLGDPVGNLALERVEDSLVASWEITGIEFCSGITPGGLLFRKCFGSQALTRLTSPRDQ